MTISTPHTKSVGGLDPSPGSAALCHQCLGPALLLLWLLLVMTEGLALFSVSGGDRPGDVHHPGGAGAGLGWPGWEVRAGDAESWICVWRNKVRTG